MKFWTSNEKGDDKIIAYNDQILYRMNPKNEDIESVLFNLNLGIVPKTISTDIPLSYIKQINIEENKSYI